MADIGGFILLLLLSEKSLLGKKGSGLVLPKTHWRRRTHTGVPMPACGGRSWRWSIGIR